MCVANRLLITEQLMPNHYLAKKAWQNAKKVVIIVCFLSIKKIGNIHTRIHSSHIFRPFRLIDLQIYRRHWSKYRSGSEKYVYFDVRRAVDGGLLLLKNDNVTREK